MNAKTATKLPRPAADVTLHGLWRWPDASGVTVFYRRCTVISFGPKQGAFHDAHEGRNVRRQIYAREYVNVSAGHGPDAEIVAALVAGQVAHLESKIAWYNADPVRGDRAYAPKTVSEWKDTLAALLAGRVEVRDHAELVAAVNARA